MEIFHRQRAFFHNGKTRSYQHRREGLARLQGAIEGHQKEIEQALYQDLGKSPLDSALSEVYFLINEISKAQRQLKSWMRPQRVKTPLPLQPSTSYLLPCPLGVVLIMAPWNYPLRLSLCPLVGALAAGNCIILKLSPHAPHTARVIEQLISQNFSPDWVSVLAGDEQEVQQLLGHPLNHIFFTGSFEVGKLVARAAIQQFTPVTLELGGQNPAVVHLDADIMVTARRLAWGKFFNNAQTCVAPNFAFVHCSVMQDFREELQRVLASWSQQHSWGKVVNATHWDRLNDLLEGQNIIYGGERNREQLLVEPTLVLNPPWESPLMQEEIFGPVLPILEYEDIHELLSFLAGRPACLSAYLFTREISLQEKFIQIISSGSVCINDVLIQANNSHLPFGGVGRSGQGRYYGKHSFLTFSHLRAVMKKSFLFDFSLRYPPYTMQKKRWLRRLGRLGS